MKSHKPVQSQGVTPTPVVQVAEAPPSNAHLAETLFNRQERGAEHSSSRTRGDDLGWLKGWLEQGPSDVGSVDEGRIRDSVSGGTDVGDARAFGSASAELDEDGLRGSATGRAEADVGGGTAGISASARASRRGVRATGSVDYTTSGKTAGIDHDLRVERELSKNGSTQVTGGASHSGTTAGIDHRVGGTMSVDSKGKADARASASASVTQGTTTARVGADTTGTVTARVGGRDEKQLFEHEQDLGHSQAKVRALGAEAGASVGGSRGPGGTTLDAQAEAALTLGEAELTGTHEVARVGDHAARVDGKLSAAAEARATAKGKATAKGDQAELSGELRAFAGAKAAAEIEGAITWDRDNYAELLADYADNLPGDFDDALLDKLPPSFWDRASKILFGQGTTELVRGGIGVDARAGAGAEAGGKLGVDKGAIEAEADVGAAVGVGGGLKTKVGLNPLDLLRRAAVAGMHVVNDVFGAAERGLRQLRGAN